MSPDPQIIQVGPAQAKRIGNLVAVTGAAPVTKDGQVAAPGDMYGQACRCLEVVDEVLGKVGASLEDVLRTRIMVTDMKLWEETARAHEEVFAKITPACTFMEVERFINPEWMIEIEVDAIVRK